MIKPNRIVDYISFVILIAIVLFMITAHDYDGGIIGRLVIIICALLSATISWKAFAEKHWAVTVFIGYLGIFVLLNGLHIIILNIFTEPYGLVINIPVFAIYFTIWFLIIKKVFPKKTNNGINSNGAA